MSVQKRFKDMLVPVSKRIIEECNNNLSERKCMALSAYMRSSFELIKKELIDTLEVITFIKPTRKEWEDIRATCREFLELQSEILKENSLRIWDHEHFNAGEFELLVRETATEYNTFIDGQLLNLVKTRRAHFFDILKRVLAAIIGSIIIYYLNKIFFK